MDEYERILSNPDNFIVSEDLIDRLGKEKEYTSVDAILSLNSSDFSCKLSSYSRTSNQVKLTLDVTHIDFSEIFSAKSISCNVCSEIFEFGSYFEYENVEGRSILILDTNAQGV